MSNTYCLRFELQRDEDITGMSGTGVVAFGVQFPNGKCSLSWNTKPSSVAIYEDINELEMIHGHSGATKVVWVDEKKKPNEMVKLVEIVKVGETPIYEFRPTHNITINKLTKGKVSNE